MKKLFEGLLFSALAVIVLAMSGLRLDYAPAQAYDVYQGAQGSKSLITSTNAPVTYGRTRTILDAVVASGVGTAVPSVTVARSFVARLSGASAVSATVLAEASHDAANYVTLCTLSLTLAAPVSSCAVSSPYPYVRGNVTAISGTGETVTMTEYE